MKREAGGGKRKAEKTRFRIRHARITDASAILEMEKLFPSDRMSARSVRNFLQSPSAKVWIAFPLPASRFPHSALGSLILLTRRNSRIARIYSVVVMPAARGCGLGAQMVRVAQGAARRHGYRQIVLEVREDNPAARALYAGLGYATQRRLPAYYDDGADGLRLGRNLGGH